MNQQEPTPVSIRRGLTAREVGVGITVALYLSSAAGVGSRIFTNGSYLGPSLGLIFMSQVLFVIALALRSPRWIAAVFSTAGLGITVTHLHAGDSHWYGLPTGETWDLIADQLREAQTLFSTTATPVAYESSWSLLFSIAITMISVTTMVSGQVLRAHFEALLPAATLFIFLSVLGTGPGGLILTLFVIISGYLMAATLRGSSHISAARLIATGTTVAVIGTIAVPYLPGVEHDPWVITRGRFGTVDTRLSPLVDIQGRLVSQSTVEMFQVEASEPAYWRMLTLTEFDGRRFTAPSSPLGITTQSELDTASTGPNLRPLEQSVRITALSGNLMPAAAVPIAAGPGPTDDPDAEPDPNLYIQWDSDISAVVRADRDLLPEDTYFLRSVIPKFQIADLLSRTAFSPPHPTFLSLPGDFPQSVIDLAAEIIAGAAAPADSGDGTRSTVPGGREPFLVARTLQDWFRSEFDYSLEIPPGHGSAALERFLEDRIGYCEQFAAAFVAMARSQGVPSRVAVGYTPGIQRQPGLYSVQGRHAHAWPEVWFDGLGWVPFEPTPGRGLPGSEDHTGLAAQQDGPLDFDEAASDGSSGFDSLDQIPDLGDLITDPDLEENLDSTAASDSDGDEDPHDGTTRRLFALGVIALLSVLGPGPWFWRQLRSRRLRRLPPHLEVISLWLGQLRSLRRHGIITDIAMNVTQIVRVAPHRLPALSEPLTGLATVAVEMGFSADPILSESELSQCRNWDEELTRILKRRRGPLSQILDYYAVWRDKPVRI